MKYWIAKDVSDPSKYVVIGGSPKPAEAIAPAPMEDGEPVTDADWLDVVEVDDGFGNIQLQPIVNPAKKQAKQDLVAQRQAAAQQAREQAQAKREAARAKLSGLQIADLQTDQAVKQAILDLVDYLQLG